MQNRSFFPSFFLRRIFLWLCAAVLCIPSIAAGQETTVLDILGAESLVSSIAGGMEIRELIGNVRMRQKNVYINCDRAVQHITEEYAELIGNVVITQDTLTLKTDKGLYNVKTKTASSTTGVYLNDGHVTLTARKGRYDTEQRIAWFNENVRIEEPQADIRADALEYTRDSSKAVAVGNVLTSFKSENSIITGDSVIHYVERKQSYFPLNPVLWQVDTTVIRKDSISGEPDSTRLDTLSIVAEHMEAHRDSLNFFLARDSVEIARRDFAARCGEIIYYRNDSLIVLPVSPVLWYEGSQITGDSVTVRMKDNTIDSMHVMGHAFSLSQSKPAGNDTLAPPPDRYDQTSGAYILMAFQNDKPSKVRVEGSAQSVYFLFDEGALNGVRVESGDIIIIDFNEDGKAEIIRTLKGVEGRYIPEKLVQGVETTFNLEGFFVRTDKPVQPLMPMAE